MNTGETPAAFLLRQRLDAAVELLRADPEKRATEVAREAGFSSVAEFARAFKQAFGLASRAWDRQSALPALAHPLYSVAELEAWRKSTWRSVRVVAFGPCRFVYFRDNPADPWSALTAWREQTGAEGMLLLQQHLGIAFPVGAAIPPLAPRMSTRDLPAMQVAMLRATGDRAEADRAWQYLYRCWLPTARYAPADVPPFEIYRSLQAPTDLDACLPLK